MTALTAVPPGVALLLVAVLIALLPRKLAHAVGASASAATLAWVWTVPAGAHLQTTFLGFETVLFNVDAFSRLMGLIFALIGVAAIVYAYGSEAESLQTAFALSYVATSFGAVFAGDWLTLLFFWELMAVTSTLLVWHYRGAAVRAGYRYALFHGLGGTLFMGAILAHYVAAGTFLFATVPGGPAVAGITAGLPAALAAVGIGVNVGFIGLHTWLPDTYSRPQIAASVFLCVFTTKTGVYGMYRAFPEGNLALAYMGGGMAVFGAGYALFQTDMRRLIAYHLQSQVGYMIAAVGIGSTLAQSGAFAHAFNHILYEGLLFMAAGAIIYRTGIEDLHELNGIARKLPVATAAFAVGALSISGFPGVNGFVSKGIIISASHYTFGKGPLPLGEFGTLEWLLLLGTALTALSFARFAFYAFIGTDSGDDADTVTAAADTVADAETVTATDRSINPASLGQTAAMLAVAVLCVAIGLVPETLFGLLPADVTDKAVVEHAYHTYTVDHIVEGVALVVAGVVGFVAVRRPLRASGRLPDLDTIYDPAVFYGGRALVVGVTELWAGVDRTVMRAVATAKRVGSHPQQVAADLGFGAAERPVQLRAGISRSAFVLVAAVALSVLIAVLL